MFAERYELGPLVGAGGGGRVHRGTDHALGRTVAMKVLGREHAHDEVARDRFRDEAVLAASVQHANVVPVLDAVEDRGELCLVMEHVDGPTLAQLVRTAPPSIDEALELLQGIAAGLAAAHRAGLVHRDLKPANILVADGVPRVVDFGLAHVLADGPDPTRTIRGSAGYLAPEQARGEDVSARTDVYALGCIAMLLLTGAPPFVGDTPLAVVGQHLHAEPPDARERDPQVPPHVAVAVARALHKDPRRRPAGPAALAAALGRPLPRTATDPTSSDGAVGGPVQDLPTDLGGDALVVPGPPPGPAGAVVAAVDGPPRPGARDEDLRRRASFGSGTLGAAADGRRPSTWLRRQRRAAVAGVVGAVLGVALAVPAVRDGAGAGVADAATDDGGIPPASDVVDLAGRLRQQLVALGAAEAVGDARVLSALAAVGRIDAAEVRGDVVAADAAAREALDLVADMLDAGSVDGAAADELLGLAGRLVTATSADG